ncbi:hypothetical protein GFO_2791 [Christiangramia forsetii KT0803]|uniref:Uncharacterized protein n=1 Tax=Christiangramia forsetii (strain DSM 17595 / CGMCC 1.15422 / KT0803) TaxID=411154 RepID=A0M550_CHRFK|nr:hypothetical protein GFO_2791 [Christiangramia forsetii KT0803]
MITDSSFPTAQSLLVEFSTFLKIRNRDGEVKWLYFHSLNINSIKDKIIDLIQESKIKKNYEDISNSSS